MKNLKVEEFANKLADAYSTENYGGNWSACIKMLRRRGYNDRQVEAIIRSKWTRWAGDASGHSYGRVNSVDLAKFMDGLEEMSGFQRSLDELVTGTFNGRFYGGAVMNTPIDELNALLKSGREFLLSLEDAALTTNEETGKELNDVAEFKAALDRAAKAVRP